MSNVYSDVFLNNGNLGVGNGTAKSIPIPGKNMVQNSEQGYVFAVSLWDRLERFLIMGSDKGTYYASDKELTIDNAKSVLACIEEDPARTVSTIVVISGAGRAPKVDATLFALALCAVSKRAEARQLAFGALSAVARTGSHLLQFVGYYRKLGGKSNRTFRDYVSYWYSSKRVESLSYQVEKYWNRNNWTHRDVFRLAHPHPLGNEDRNILYHYIAKGWENVGDNPHPIKQVEFLWACNRIKQVEGEHEAAGMIAQYDLPREVVPTQLLGSPVIWEALLAKMPPTAMIRNLGKMTSVGLLKFGSPATDLVCRQLSDASALSRARIHPINLLSAATTYASGKGLKGSNVWSPVPQIMSALDAAFYESFGYVHPTGARIMLALDGSGSMKGTLVDGMNLSAYGASAFMATLMLKTEHSVLPIVFDKRSRYGEGVYYPRIHGGMGIEEVVNQLKSLAGGGTDCSLPIQAIRHNHTEVDAVVMITDSEDYAGDRHVNDEIRLYRQQVGRPVPLVVVSLTANGYSIADPDDALSMNCVGFDQNVPQLISDFIRTHVGKGCVS